jgi:hypothetical protein
MRGANAFLWHTSVSVIVLHDDGKGERLGAFFCVVWGEGLKQARVRSQTGRTCFFPVLLRFPEGQSLRRIMRGEHTTQVSLLGAH